MGGGDRHDQEIFPRGFGFAQLDRHPKAGPRVTAKRTAQMPGL